MKLKLRIGALLACSVALACAVGCGDDDDSPPDDNGGDAGEPGEGATGGTDGGRSGGTGGRAGSGGRGGEAGDPVMAGAGAGGQPNPPTCNIYDPDRPLEPIPVDGQGVLDTNDTTFTLTSDRTWELNGRTFVPEGVTLIIEPCTLIVGSRRPDAGSLFIMRGAQIDANGTADEPIVFSSDDFEAHPNAPWGGIALLGRAPIGASSTDTGGQGSPRIFEGLTDTNATYGGDDPEDSSGSMSYVRIEYGGDIILGDREINGLTLSGVGSGTDLHHIMVKRTMDDCFEFFGGTVDAHHLICENAGDDMFDTDENYRGRLQFLFGRLTLPGTSSDPNGFEWDGNQLNQMSAERSIPMVANATLCGLGSRGAATSYGAILRRGLMDGTSLQNTIITGFDHGFDTRDVVPPALSWTTSLFFEQLTNNFTFAAEVAAPGTPLDNDNAFDEFAWITDAANENDDTKPEGFDCYADPPAPFPTDAVAGGTPDAPFDDTADFVGAFRDAEDNWMTGAWVDWSSGD